MVASLELCKELYELSGWTNAEYIWDNSPSFEDGLIESTAKSQGFDVKAERTPVTKTRYASKDFICPAYSLSYLLRKLPAHILSAKHEEQTWLFVEKDDDGYGAGYQTITGETWELYYPADTPEDAACKLATELFKQGVLTNKLKSMEDK